MDSRNQIIPSPEAIYPNRLTETAHAPVLPGRTWMWLAGLFFLALIPRALMAWRNGAICDDAYYYIFVANSLKHKDLTLAFDYLNLNLYPAILLVLHNLGLDWIVAGKLWGVFISSLMVLPMFAWIRRMFDDRIAATACFLFAIHPELIEVSVEPIRGPTFWFLIALGLYFSWRAVTETKWWLFLTAGFVLSLAIHTRSEGWILFAPFALWTCFRMIKFSDRRRKLALGAVCCVVMIPLMILLVNVTLLKNHDQWEWGRLSHFEMCWQWVKTELGFGNEALTGQGMSHLLSDGRIQNYSKRLIRNLEPVNLIFLLVGMIGWRRTLLKRDKLVLVIVAAGFLLAIWIRLSQIGDMNGRYFFPVYFLLLPFAAISFLWTLNRLEQFGRRLFKSVPLQLAPVALLIGVLSSVFLTDALTAYHRHREAQDSLGRWLNEKYGPMERVTVNQSAIRVGYFAVGGQPIVSNRFFTSERSHAPGVRPQLVILSTRQIPADYQSQLQGTLDRWNWQQIPAEQLPETAAGFLVFINPPLLEKTAIRPDDKSPGKTTLR